MAELSGSGPTTGRRSAALPSSRWVRTADPAFRAGLDHIALTDSAGITAVRSTASEVFWSARQIRTDPRDGFLVAVHGRGCGSVEQNGRLVTMTQGHAAIYHTETPYTLSFPDAMSETVLHIPRTAIDPRGTRSADITARLIGPDKPGAVRPDHADVLACRRPVPLRRGGPTGRRGRHRPGPDRDRPARARRGAGSGRERLALRSRVHAFVDANLADSALTPDTLAAGHHVSLRHLQAVLAEAGETPAYTKTFKAACVQAEPVWLDLQGSIEKTITLAADAADNGAAVVAFPESWIPGYRWWIWLA